MAAPAGLTSSSALQQPFSSRPEDHCKAAPQTTGPGTTSRPCTHGWCPATTYVLANVAALGSSPGSPGPRCPRRPPAPTPLCPTRSRGLFRFQHLSQPGSISSAYLLTLPTPRSSICEIGGQTSVLKTLTQSHAHSHAPPPSAPATSSGFPTSMAWAPTVLTAVPPYTGGQTQGFFLI